MVRSDSEKTLTLPARALAERRIVDKKLQAVVAAVAIVALHKWAGAMASVPAALLMAMTAALISYWKLKRSADKGRPQQKLSFGETIKRTVPSRGYESSVDRSQVSFIRTNELESGRMDLVAVLHNGSQYLLLQDVLPSELKAASARLDTAFIEERPAAQQRLLVRVESTTTGYRDVEQALAIEVPARPFVGKARSIFDPRGRELRGFQRVRVGEKLIVETRTAKRELGRTEDVSLRIEYGRGSADVWARSADGSESLLVDGLDAEELDDFRKALPDSLVVK